MYHIGLDLLSSLFLPRPDYNKGKKRLSLLSKLDKMMSLSVNVYNTIFLTEEFCYVDPSSESVGAGIDSLADAVTHARFVGTDPSSDEVVLMKILQVRLNEKICKRT